MKHTQHNIILKTFKNLNIMKHTIYNGIENLTKKEIINARANEKREVCNTLSDFALSLESAYKQLTATGSSCRNTANACKGEFKTALNVVVNCYPYQTKDGKLCTKTKDGFKERKLKGTSTAYAVVKTAVNRFIDYKTKRVENLVEIVETISE